MLKDLEQGREHYERRAWLEAYRSLSRADEAGPLEGEDLERLATSAYLAGYDDAYLAALDRAHRTYLDASAGLRAARCAFWLGLRFLFRGEVGPATGWLARAQRLLEHEHDECVEHGYLLLPLAQQQINAGDSQVAYATAARAAEIGERCREPDLIAIARHLQGRTLLEQGQIEPGLALLDEAMVAVTAGELSPIVTGLVYCSVIEGCQQVYALGRAREWTTALAQWCDDQPELMAFTGICRVHRAEIMQLRGAWREAAEEAQRACERCIQTGSRQAVAAAFYQQAEIHRLRGAFAAAEEDYRKASEWGRDPQPGLALMRLAQGRSDVAAAAMRRALSSTKDPLQRTRLLPAHTEIMLAAGDLDEAHAASAELQEIAQRIETGATGVLGAMAAQALGSVALASGDPHEALVSLRRAWRVWQQIDATYLAARVRVQLGLACRALGDEDGSTLDFDAARAAFERLGATSDLARLHSLTAKTRTNGHRGLTARELQVLRLVAEGKTNKVIAAELFLSEKTIDRHVSKIFDKLDVPSRAAATAYAYAHQLI
jgi:DNA-binding CsgD family transcriptional regulator/tetratricopeptide (TPR) repeat protein